MRKKEAEDRTTDLPFAALSSNHSITLEVLKAEQSRHALNVPLRLGKRKLVCGCGGKLQPYRVGLTEYEVKCQSCKAGITLSSMRTIEVLTYD